MSNELTQREQLGLQATVDAIAAGAFGISDQEIGAVRGYIGDQPVAVLTLIEGNHTMPVAALLLDDAVHAVTFPEDLGVLHDNPSYIPATPEAASV